MEPFEPEAFVALRKDIESHPRLSGYYLLKLVAIADLRARGLSDQDVADAIFEHLDDHPWPPRHQRPTRQPWADYETNRTTARGHVLECLVGGSSVGHINITIPEPRAIEYFDRFDALLPKPKRYYIGLGLGNPGYAFTGGVAIIAPNIAGCLCVVEND